MKLVSDGESAGEGGVRIRSVERASRLLLWIATQPDGDTATGAARAAGLALPTAYHLLGTLVAGGLLAKDSRRRYVLGPKAGVVADAYWRSDRVPEYLLAPLRALADRTGETAYLAGWRGGEIRARASVEGTSPVRVAEVQRGPYRHAHARATGKLLLALASEELRSTYLAANPLERLTDRTICDPGALAEELEGIRRQGFATDVEEFHAGVSCVAAPLLEDGIVIATFTVSAPAERFARRRDDLLAAVLSAATDARAAARGLAESHDAPEAA